MGRVHAVMSQKGGVGKTTIVVHTAATIADALHGTPDNTPVLGVSVDPQASMYEWAKRAKRMTDDGEVSTLPFDFVQCHEDPGQLAKLKSLRKYKHIFVDTPGALDMPGSDERLKILKKVLEIADDVIVPIEPEPLAFTPAARTIETVIKPSGKPFKIVVNNHEPRDGEHDLNQTLEFIERRGYPRFNTIIRHYKLHTRAPAGGITVVTYPENRVARAARQDFLKFGIEVMALDAGEPRHALPEGGNGVTTVEAD